MELRGAVLPDVPRVVRLRLSPGRREREHVGRRDVRDAAGREQRPGSARARPSGPGRARSSAGTPPRRTRRLAVSSRPSRARTQVLAPVAKPGVLVRLGVGVDADDARGRPREHLRAVALAACHVDHPQPDRPARRSTRTPPDGAGTSSSPPGRRAAFARRSARAAAHLAAGSAVRRCSSEQGDRVICAPAMEAVRSADEIRDVNTRYHDVAAAGYDSKWGIDFGEIGQAQVLGKLRKVLGVRARPRVRPARSEIGAGTGYFSLNLLQAGVVRGCDLHRHLARDGPTLADNAARLGLSVRAARAEAESLPFADRELRPRARARGAPPPPRPARVRSTSSIACCAPAGGSCSRASPRAPETGWQASQSGAPTCVAPAVARAAAARRLPACGRRHRSGSRHDHGLERMVDIHAFAPATSWRSRAWRASATSRSAARSCSRTGSGGSTARWRRGADPDQVPMLWRQYAFHGYLALQRARRPTCSSRGCRRRSSTTCCWPRASRKGPAAG